MAIAAKRIADLPPGAEKHWHLFRKSLPTQVKLHEVVRLLGPLDNRDCLEIGANNAFVSYHLRKRGGRWSTAVTTAELGATVKLVTGVDAHVLANGALPYENKSFDIVVVMDVLERVNDEALFIEECHRVLKPDGRLILNACHAKRWSLLRGIERLMGLTFERKGMKRPGYTEPQMFRILKNGFDVHKMHTYSRFCIQLVDAFVQAGRLRIKARHRGDGRLMQLYSLAGPFYRLAFQVDMLLFFSRGHNLIASAKRRAWLPRKTPVLSDGRSITEAVLSRAGS